MNRAMLKIQNTEVIFHVLLLVFYSSFLSHYPESEFSFEFLYITAYNLINCTCQTSFFLSEIGMFSEQCSIITYREVKLARK